MSDSPWYDTRGVCQYAPVGRKMVYQAVAAGQLRAAHVDGRRKLIFHKDWVDAWLNASASGPAVVEIRRDRGAA
jgi:excisionase family DNA binding protein